MTSSIEIFAETNDFFCSSLVSVVKKMVFDVLNASIAGSKELRDDQSR